jgi:hypothetical protein
MACLQDDNIERRDLVKIYERVRKEMEKEISRLAHTAQYDSAKEMRERLTSLRSEFDHLQTSSVDRSHREQEVHLERASKMLMNNLKSNQNDQLENLRDHRDHLKTALERQHEIEWENLEVEISRMARPPVKYSKRLIELFKAESSLIKLNQYDDARTVRNMIDRIKPGEEKRAYDVFDSSIEAKREQLRRKQQADGMRLEEKVTGIEWEDLRRKDRETAV